jgi:hypothetical protein
MKQSYLRELITVDRNGPAMRTTSNDDNQRSPSEDPFEFIAGANPATVRIVFRGFWTEETVECYLQALHKRAANPAGASAITKVLLDMRACVVQSQLVMDSFARIMVSYAAQIKEYGILLPGSALLELQMRRLMLPASTQFFDEEEPALQWLGASETG